MKILAIGDIFGEVGRRIIVDFLPRIKKEYSADFVIANIENATHGKSISKNHFYLMKSSGIDVMTSGNHIFSSDETKRYISEFPNLLRPLNSNPFHPGEGTFLTSFNGKKIRVTNLIGNAFMPYSENPYFYLEKVIEKKDCDIHIVDFHAESTAEKIALAWYYDGVVSLVYGTHTHVQTADERILPSGTAFITDIGMTGPSKGIIGAKPWPIIERTKFGFSSRMEPNIDPGHFNGIVVDFSDDNNNINSIVRINLSYESLSKKFR